jgi:hypothetical protein
LVKIRDVPAATAVAHTSIRSRSTTALNAAEPRSKIGRTALTLRWLWNRRCPVSSANAFATVNFPTAGGP